MPVYEIRYDDTSLFELEAASLAAVANIVRQEILKSRVKRVRVWVNHSGVQLIDTKFGDAYDLIAK